MGTYGGIGITPGTGAEARIFTDANSDAIQIIREHRATAETENFWTVSTTGVASQIAADNDRVSVLMTSFANGRVYLRFDATIPTATTAHTFIDPNERFLVPIQLSHLAISVLGAVGGGILATHLGTAA